MIIAHLIRLAWLFLHAWTCPLSRDRGLAARRCVRATTIDESPAGCRSRLLTSAHVHFIADNDSESASWESARRVLTSGTVYDHAIVGKRSGLGAVCTVVVLQ